MRFLNGLQVRPDIQRRVVHRSEPIRGRVALRRRLSTADGSGTTIPVVVANYDRGSRRRDGRPAAVAWPIHCRMPSRR